MRKQHIKELQDHFKCVTCFRISEGEEREIRTEEIFEEIMADNFP